MPPLQMHVKAYIYECLRNCASFSFYSLGLLRFSLSRSMSTAFVVPMTTPITSAGTSSVNRIATPTLSYHVCTHVSKYEGSTNCTSIYKPSRLDSCLSLMCVCLYERAEYRASNVPREPSRTSSPSAQIQPRTWTHRALYTPVTLHPNACNIPDPQPLHLASPTADPV